MTDNKAEAGGLPELEASNKTNRKPPVLLLAILILILFGVGVGIQYGINYLGFFNEKEVVIEEPPIPELALTEEPEPYSPEPILDTEDDKDFVVSGVINDEPQTNEIKPVSDTEVSKDYSEITSVLLVLAEELGEIKVELVGHRNSLNEVIDNQKALANQISFEVNRRQGVEKALQSGLKENQRWLGGLSNQLKDIGVDVKVASQEFPIVVYSRNVWGDDVFLTVAQKVAPEQTSFLRIGGIVGRWRLLKILDEKAVFEHFEGNRKEVML